MTIINISEAKTQLSRYAKRIKQGEVIILADRNKPFAEIRPLSPEITMPTRQLGQLTGKIQFEESFWEADAEIAQEMMDGGVFPVRNAR